MAAVRLFASVDGASSSTKDLGHAWLTVENISRSNINVGKFGIAPGKTISIGTWSGQSEHTGLWYCLESKLISKSSSQWKKRTSIKVNIGAASLGKLTDFIVKNDKWSIFNNCSSFATKGWNLVASTKISAGAINTPAATQSNIIKTGLASTGIKVPHYFAVYYAQGTNRPKRSTVH